MLSLKDFKKFDLGSKVLNNFTGGSDGGHIGCVDCAGNTTYCPSSSSCDTIDCPKGNDVGGDKAKGCGSSAVVSIGGSSAVVSIDSYVS